MTGHEGSEGAAGIHDREQPGFVTAIVSSLGEGVVAVDRTGRITFVNRAAADLLKWSTDDLMGKEADSTIGHWAAGPAADPGAPLMEPRAGESVFKTADGREIPVLRSVAPLVQDGEHVGSVVCFRDMSPRKAFEQELLHHAFHDHLTGLANRSLFGDRLAQAHARAARTGSLYAVMFVDLDDFKSVNDSLGHAGGDEVLVAVARVLQHSVRPSDTVARFGGDEFTLVLDDVASVEAAEAVARRVLSGMHAPVQIRGLELSLSASIGIVIADGRSGAASECIRAADLAMYRAKTKGRGRYEVSGSSHARD